MKVVGTLQARMASTRLPGKAMADVAGLPLLGRVLERLRAAPSLSSVVVATTTRPEDDAIESWARRSGAAVFRGSSEDVVGRIAAAVAPTGADVVALASGDSPLLDPDAVERAVARLAAGGVDLAFVRGLPLGSSVDVASRSALETADREAAAPAHREHVNSFLLDHARRFRIEPIPAAPDRAAPRLRLTVDTPEDIEVVREVYRRLSRPGRLIDLADVVSLSRTDPALFEKNAHVSQHYVSDEAKRIREG